MGASRAGSDACASCPSFLSACCLPWLLQCCRHRKKMKRKMVQEWRVVGRRMWDGAH